MVKKTVTYKDYKGTERTEDFYFNLNKAEVMEMELGVNGGMAEMIQRIVDAKDGPTIIKIFKDVVLRSYGKISDDGRQFIKNEKLKNEFAQTEAYVEIFTTLATDSKAAADFVNGIMPKEAVKNNAVLTPVK